jgi:hypothetical protein
VYACSYSLSKQVKSYYSLCRFLLVHAINWIYLGCGPFLFYVRTILFFHSMQWMTRTYAPTVYYKLIKIHISQCSTKIRGYVISSSKYIYKSFLLHFNFVNIGLNHSHLKLYNLSINIQQFSLKCEFPHLIIDPITFTPLSHQTEQQLWYNLLGSFVKHQKIQQANAPWSQERETSLTSPPKTLRH